jgi:hypothetical protein
MRESAVEEQERRGEKVEWLPRAAALLPCAAVYESNGS